jgi:two-component system chemotaxis sensor kinase CheA
MAKSDDAAKVDLEELSDEDKELIQIFLSASEQYMETIGTCLANLKNGENVTESIEIYRKAVESLKSSAKFMGYESILDSLDGQMDVLSGDSAESGDGPKLFTDIFGHFDGLREKIFDISKSAGIPYDIQIPLDEPDVSPVDIDEDEGVQPIDTGEDEVSSVDTEEVSEERITFRGGGGGGLPPAGPPGDGGEPPGGDVSYSRQTLRVETDRVDNIMNLVGELVVNKASFSQLINNFKDVYRDILDLKKLDKAELNSLRQLALFFEESTAELGRVSNELQEGVMRVRMVSINQLFTRFPRLVRDLAHKMNKDVKLVITGRETELDKSVIEEIGDPLTHIIRNAIAHGFETVEERKKMGKPKEGTLSISAYHQGNQVIIEVTDDGRGIDIDKIKQKMEEDGEVSAAEVGRITDREAINYLFRAGISMTDKISHVSGRGVGLDIVKKNIDKLKGGVDVVTEKGVGTSFVIKLPLTLAIIQALIVGIADKVFSIPLSAVTETVRISAGEIDSIEGHQVLRLRDKVLPLLKLSEIFKMNVGWEGDVSGEEREIFIVILSAEDREIGLVVDRLIGEEDIVIKSLEEYLSNTRGISGASIMGDGTIALILDVVELVNLAIAKEKEIRGKQAEERFKRRKKTVGSRDDIPPQ